MKKVIVIIDDDSVYSKKFCNQAIKLLGKEYLFLCFSNIKALKEYSKENKIESAIISESFLEDINELKINNVYLLNEKNRKAKKEGKKTYIYKFQNIKNILEKVDEDIRCKNTDNKNSISQKNKLIAFYSPIYVKNKLEIVKKIAKSISKKDKILIIDIDEFDNYKGSVGLSNIIYNYKENNLNVDTIKKEIINDKDIDYIKSTTYPEDMSIITNIDLSNIVNSIKNVGHNYIFINCDTSYIKCQYILNDADEVVLIKDKENEKLDKFKNYIKSENQIDIKKVTEYDITKNEKAYITAFIKQCIKKEDD